MKSSFAEQAAAARPRVIAVVDRLVGSDAEDVAQEAILRAFLSLPQLRDTERFESWLCGIAINVAKMRLRRAAIDARALARVGPVDEPGDVWPEREMLELVREAVELLPPRQREAVLLHYVDGLSCDEIAGLLRSTSGAVRVRLHRARRQLRRELALHLPEHDLVPKEERMRELEVHDVLVRVASDDPQTVVWDSRIIVLRERDGEQLLPVWVSGADGNALAWRLRESKAPRPLSGDLMAELVRTLGGKVDEVAITRLEDSVFYGRVIVNGEELDARPSDAINLAVRLGAPIFVDSDVLATEGIGREQLLAKCESTLGPPPGEWRSLSADVLSRLHPPPK